MEKAFSPANNFVHVEILSRKRVEREVADEFNRVDKGKSGGIKVNKNRTNSKINSRSLAYDTSLFKLFSHTVNFCRTSLAHPAWQYGTSLNYTSSMVYPHIM